MSGLETSFYIVSIVFMSIMLMLVITVVVALVVIRNKVVALEKTVAEKLHTTMALPEKVIEIATAVKKLTKSIG